MTPPSGKPNAPSSAETDLGQTDATPDTTETTETAKAGRGGVTRLRPGAGMGAGPAKRRPAAALELRVARSRADGEEGEAANAAPAGARPGRGAGVGHGVGHGNGAGRFGGRGLRAGKAAQADASDAEVVADAEEVSADADAVDMVPAVEAVAAVEPPMAVPVAPRAAAVTPAAAPALAAYAEDEDDEDESDHPGPARGRRKAAVAAKRAGAGAKPGKIDLSNYVVAPTASPAGLRRRHWGVIGLFLIMVILPTVVYSWYLWNRSADQYESDVGFGSRSEDAPSTFDFLGALGGSSTSSAKDMDILNQFILSQELVQRIDKKLDLRTIYGKPQNDPLATFDPKGTIEDLVDYWRRMVIVNYDSSTGLMDLEVFAFDPKDAQMIAKEVLDESSDTINQLSQTATDDTTRYSKEALQVAEDRLSKARVALTDYRVKNHIVDPSNEISSQMSVLGTLVQQLAAAQIDLDLLTGVAAENDPRVAQLNRRIDVINNRIKEEQSKVGAVSDSNSTGYATLVSDYERLQVDSEFAEKAYLSALASYDQAVNDAQHKTRYLATYVAPTLAQASTAPNRPLTAGLTALVGLLAWSITVLIYYALRDRR